MAERAAMRPGPQGQSATGSHKIGTFAGCAEHMYDVIHSDVTADGNEGTKARSHYTRPSMVRRMVFFDGGKKKLVRSESGVCILRMSDASLFRVIFESCLSGN